MQPLDDERRMIDAAIELAGTLGSDDNHTVAAAVLDVSGRIHVGVNVHHFTGGPCAEPVAIGAAVAAGAGSGRLLAIAAAGDAGRGLLSPCGRCRQILLDLHPDILVAIPGPDAPDGTNAPDSTDAPAGPDLVPIRKLLPAMYRQPDAAPRRLVRFAAQYHDDIVRGGKTTTVRFDDPIVPGPALFVFEGHPDHATVDGEVLSVTTHDLATAAPTDLYPGTSETMDQIVANLRRHYPDLRADAHVEVVAFRVAAEQRGLPDAAG